MPPNLEAISDEELMEMFEAVWQAMMQDFPRKDCRDLEEAAAPSAEASASLEQAVRLRAEVEICGQYVSFQESDPRIQAAEKRRKKAYNDVCAVWSAWAAHEPYHRPER